MQKAAWKFDERHKSHRGPLELILQEISHELRLQALGAKFSANVQRALAGCDFFIPRTQVENRPVEFTERSPHQPPAFVGSLQLPAIRAGAPIERFHDFC